MGVVPLRESCVGVKIKLEILLVPSIRILDGMMRLTQPMEDCRLHGRACSNGRGSIT